MSVKDNIKVPIKETLAMMAFIIVVIFGGWLIGDNYDSLTIVYDGSISDSTKFSGYLPNNRITLMYDPILGKWEVVN